MHTLVIEKHFYLEQKANDEETIQYNVQKLTNIIEGYIRKYPPNGDGCTVAGKAAPSP